MERGEDGARAGLIWRGTMVRFGLILAAGWGDKEVHNQIIPE